MFIITLDSLPLSAIIITDTVIMRAHGSDPVINALFTAMLWCLSATARKLPAGSVLPITCLDDHIKTLRAARASHRAAGKMSSAFVVSFLCVWSEMGRHLTYK